MILASAPGFLLAGCGSSHSGIGTVSGAQVGGRPAVCDANYAPFSFGNGPGPEISVFDLNRGSWIPESMDYFVPGPSPLHLTQQFASSGFGMTPQAICGSVHQPGRPNPPAVRVGSFGSMDLGYRSGFYFYQWSMNYARSGTDPWSWGYRSDQVMSRAFRASSTEVVVQSRSADGGPMLVTRYRLR